MELHGKTYAKDALRKRVGNPDQLSGIKLVRFDDGIEHPGRAALFHTGSGLEFTVYLDRGMDIASARFQGRAMGWRATSGDVAPQYYEAEGIRWLRSYFGGLLTTCGLQNVGAPAPDSPESGQGLHGRIGNLPAKDLKVVQEWQDDDYILSVTGTMRETRLFGENLTLSRTVHTRLGETRFWIEDRICNEGFEPAPLMLLYHCNIGWPAVEDGSIVAAPSRRYSPRDAEAQDGHEAWATLTAPSHGYSEKVYFHDMAPDPDGYVTAAVLDADLAAGQPGFGVYVKYRQAELPRFTQWKMLGEQAYVVGLEPSNCGVQGQAKDREDGLLQTLAPGETVSTRLEFGTVTDPQAAKPMLAWQSDAPSEHAASYLEFTPKP